MAVVGAVVIPDVAVGVVQARCTVAALPQETVIGAELVFAVLEVAFVDGFHELIHAKIGLLGVALDVQPQSAVAVAHGRPHAGTLEEFVAENLAHVCRVVLEPLEVQLAHALQRVVLVIVVFAQVHAKVGMVPVGVVALVLLAVPSLGTAARGVALEPQAHAIDDRGLAVLDKRDVCLDILGREAVGVIQGQQPVPLVEAHAQVNLGDGGIVPHVIISLPDGFGQLAAQQVVDDGIDVGDVDLTVIVDVAAVACVVVGKTAQNDVNEPVDIGNIDLAVTIHVTHFQCKRVG